MSDSPLRIAVYGYVEKEAGGLASANFVVLERLLQRGCFIDFHAIDPWVRPEELFAAPRFRYCGYRLEWLERGWGLVRCLPTRRLRHGAEFAYSQFAAARYNRAIERGIATAHRRRPYDALLTMGLLSPFRVAGLPAVSWTQGAPNGEREALVGQRSLLTRLCGRRLYAALMALYRWREWVARRQLRHSALVIGGSRWAVDSWRRLGLPAGRGFALPYPVDLKRFAPSAKKPAAGRAVVLLHLGRLAPRKRVDLLLEGFQLLRRRERDVLLRVIGSIPYATGYQALLRDPRLMEGVEYRSHVPWDEALAALAQADVVVQPSENENLGTAVAEAQACGLPVVVGPTNGTQDYLDTRELAFQAYEPEAVADAMARAVRAVRGRGPELRAGARAAAERHYDPDAVADRLERILRRAAGQTGAATAEAAGAEVDCP
jgi:glycosyltransferase involved in cell wall biosynthesis